MNENNRPIPAEVLNQDVNLEQSLEESKNSSYNSKIMHLSHANLENNYRIIS